MGCVCAWNPLCWGLGKALQVDSCKHVLNAVLSTPINPDCLLVSVTQAELVHRMLNNI